MAPPPFRTFTGSLARYGESTKWPGYARFAIVYVLFAILLSLAHFGISIYIAHNLLHMPDRLPCWDSSVQRTVMMNRPLMVWDMSPHGGKYWFGLEGPPGEFGITMVAIIMPLAMSSFFIYLLINHFRGLSNWHAFWRACMLFTMFVALRFADSILKIDHSERGSKWRVCRTGQAQTLMAESTRRTVMMNARQWLSSFACMFLMLYTHAVLWAAYLNYKEAKNQQSRATELQVLSSNPTVRALRAGPSTPVIITPEASVREPEHIHTDRGQASRDEEADLGVQRRQGEAERREQRQADEGDAAHRNSFADPVSKAP